jgi:hypothetical protein
LRKALFAIVLVAASFAGGATVNGPGLRWVRDMILSQPGAEITTTTLGDPAADAPSEANASSGAGVAPTAEIPARPIPPLVLPTEPSASAPAPPPPAARASEGSSPSPQVAIRSDSEPPWAPAPAPPRPSTPETPEKALGVKPAEANLAIAPVPASPSVSEPPAPLPMTRDRNPEPAPPRPIATAAPVDRDINLAVLSSGSRATPPHRETRTEPTPTPAPAAGGAPAPGLDDWGAIRRKMHALGVTRYGIEGEPEGRVRFHCVIPLAGRHAVSQQFEGEGNDEIEAAQTALRRVALWRATEPPPAQALAPPPSVPAP